MNTCKFCGRRLPETEFYPSFLRRHHYICRDCCTKSRKIDDNYKIGGWKIIYLNYVKKGEYRFQAYNTDGRYYATNDAIEIQSALDEIFANVCK